jgi:hypothetical protein
MTKGARVSAELGKLLAEVGADMAVAPFSGGNDEGGIESVELMKDGETFDSVGWAEKDATRARIYEIMEEPVAAEYGSFAGEFFVSGEVVYEPESQRLRMTRTESYEVSNEPETSYH